MLVNIIANLIGRLWGTISNFLFIPLYIHYLGFDSYSIISFTLIVAGLMAIIDAGVTATLSRELARLDKTHDEKIRLFKTLEAIYFVIVFLCIILVYVSSDFISQKWLNTNSFNSAQVSYFLKIIGIDVGFQLLFRFYLGGMLGLEKQIKSNMYQVGWGVLRNGGVVVAILYCPSLDMFFAWQAISSVIFAILARFSLYKILFDKYLCLSIKFQISVLADVWRFAGGMFLISLVAGINSQLDKLVISVLLPIEVLGYYTLSVSLGLGLVMLVSPISTALLPRFTALYSSGNGHKASTLFQKVVLSVSVLIFSLMSNMLLNAESILWIWTGQLELAMQASLYLPIIVVAYSMLSLAIIPFTIAIANGYTKINNILGLCSLLLTLPGYWIGAKFYGAIGAATVYCIAQTAITLIYFYFVNKRFINVSSLKKLYCRDIISPLIATSIIAYSFSFIPDLAGHDRIIALFQFVVKVMLTITLTLSIVMPKDIYILLRRVRLNSYN